MTELHLFAGAGGGILGGMLLGHTTVAAVEIEPFCQGVLRARQRDGALPEFPVFGDIREFDGRPWRGRVDIVAGGFPCQDISVAGRGAGLAGERSGLWGEFARVIGEVRPRYAFIENSPALVGRGLDRVLADLAALGMDARWCVLGADDAGAPHQRKRIWILAYTDHGGRGASGVSSRLGQVVDGQTNERGAAAESGALADADAQRRHGRAGEPRAGRRGESANGGGEVADADGAGHEGLPGEAAAEVPRSVFDGGHISDADGQRLAQRRRIARDDGAQLSPAARACDGRSTRRPEPGMGRMDDGLASWVDRSSSGRVWASDPADEGRMGRTARGIPNRAARLRALGNGQVPQVAAMAWRVLTAGLVAA